MKLSTETIEILKNLELYIHEVSALKTQKINHMMKVMKRFLVRLEEKKLTKND